MHNDVISDLAVFRILQTIFNARTLKFDTNVSVNVTFGTSSQFC